MDTANDILQLFIGWNRWPNRNGFVDVDEIHVDSATRILDPRDNDNAILVAFIIQC